VASERGLQLERVLDLVEEHSSRPFLGLAGPKSINVLELNLALEQEAG
jgi:potassium-transporting ATPase KdpC subunit